MRDLLIPNSYFISSFLTALLIACGLLLSFPASAQLPNSGTTQAPITEDTRPAGGRGLINPLGSLNVQQGIGRTVSWLGGLAGSLFFIFLLWGGIQWMTAGGDAGKVKKAQGRIVASVMGIAVVLFAYIAVATIIGLVP